MLWHWLWPILFSSLWVCFLCSLFIISSICLSVYDCHKFWIHLDNINIYLHLSYNKNCRFQDMSSSKLEDVQCNGQQNEEEVQWKFLMPSPVVGYGGNTETRNETKFFCAWHLFMMNKLFVWIKTFYKFSTLLNMPILSLSFYSDFNHH